LEGKAVSGELEGREVSEVYEDGMFARLGSSGRLGGHESRKFWKVREVEMFGRLGRLMWSKFFGVR
jgi:hypothetical protein